jgi:peptidoglycan hydrolase-like protein with peptidoglycan-binding domain
VLSEIQRDLASTELWTDSLERSLRRRALAPIARKREARKKRTSLVAGAAVATAPMVPSLGAADAASSHATHDHGNSRRLEDQAHERILLRRGDTSPAVGELQRALNINVDDIFGPETEGAVRALQTRAKLPVTGKVDARTWLTVFPNDAIIAVTGPTPPGSSRSTHATAQWAAVTVPTTTHANSQPAAGQTLHTASVASMASAAKAPEGASAAPTQVGAGSGGVSAPPLGSGHHPPTAAPVSTAPPAAAPVPSPAPATPAPTTIPAPTRAPATPAPTTISVPGSTGGQAVQIQAPTPGSAQTAAALVAQMIAAADAIDSHHYAYRWGGGHNSSFSGPYDCSGAVSAVLHAAGLVSAPLVSGDFMRWGAPGPGTVTIYANAGHVYMSINGRFFGTSSANAGGGAGWYQGGARPGFVVVHVPFERMHLRPSAARVKAARARRQQRRQATAVAAVQPRTSGSTAPAAGTAPGSGATSAGGTAAPAAQPQSAPGVSAGTPATVAPSSSTPATVAPSTTPDTVAPQSGAPSTVAPSSAPATVAPTSAPEAAPDAGSSAPAPAASAPSPSTDTTVPASSAPSAVTTAPAGAVGPGTAVTAPAPAATQPPAPASGDAVVAPASDATTTAAGPAPESDASGPVASDAPTAPATSVASDGSAATSSAAEAPPSGSASGTATDESATQGGNTATAPAAA